MSKTKTQKQNRKLVSIEIGKATAGILDELSHCSNFKNSSFGAIIEDIVDTYFLKDFLLDYVNPAQFDNAKTFEDRANLAIAFLRAKRGVSGYWAETKFGPYVVHSSQEDI